ncbi:hypothetical protein ES708_23572 [subsurface metagenome]
MGKPAVTFPPLVKSTVKYSAKPDKIRKKIYNNHLSEVRDKEGAKYIKRTIANPITIPI